MIKRMLAFLTGKQFISAGIYAFLLFSAVSSVLAQAPGGFADLDASLRELRQKLDDTGPGIVLISVYDDTGEEVGRGSGLFIDSSGNILTGAELFSDAYSAEVFSQKGYYSKVTLLNRNVHTGLALVRVSAENEQHLELEESYAPQTGDRVTIVGRSDELERTLSEGLINTISSIGEELELVEVEVTVPISTIRPSEDGALLNEENRVIGLIVHDTFLDRVLSVPAWTFGDQTLHAVSAGTIRRFLAESADEKELHIPKSRVWHRWIVKKTKTEIMHGFLYVYQLKSSVVIAVFLGIAVLVTLVQWAYSRIRK